MTWQGVSVCNHEGAEIGAFASVVAEELAPNCRLPYCVGWYISPLPSEGSDYLFSPARAARG
eukprot:8303133-Pyramimonas_sp.AAC.1